MGNNIKEIRWITYIVCMGEKISIKFLAGQPRGYLEDL